MNCVFINKCYNYSKSENTVMQKWIENLCTSILSRKYIWAATCDYQQRGILTRVDSDERVQPLLSLETPNDVQSVAKHL